MFSFAVKKESSHKKNRRSTFLCLAILLFLFLTSENLISNDSERIYPRSYGALYDFKNKGLSFDIECHSGTPPILEFILKDPAKIVKKVLFDFDGDGEIDLTIDNIVSNDLFRGVPYWKSGRYQASVYLDTSYGVYMREFVISFTDFLWGRDNFCFANDGKFEDAIHFVSKTVIDWAQERFGSCTQDEKILLLYVMYDIYKGSIGRCYGFSGGETYYDGHPDRLPYPYYSTYSIDERDRSIIRYMDFLQNDIVFSNFISGRIDLHKKQDSQSLREEISRIKRSIDSGKLIILPYLSKKMHHSMVVYGYFENDFRDRITLLVANNWEREQSNNVYSEDAENIVIQFTRSSHKITWYDLTRRKYRYPEKIFAIDGEESFSLNPEDFFSLLKRKKEELMKKDKMLFIVEKTEHAYVVDEEGKKKGYSKPKLLNELEEVSFKKIDYNYIFEIPKDKEYSLVLKKRRYNEEQKRYKEVNIFGIVPENGTIRSFMINDVPMEKESEKIFIVNSNGIFEKEELDLR